MCRKLNLFLPPFKIIPFSHLQKIFMGEKGCLKKSQVPTVKLGFEIEFSTKCVIKNGYLPSNTIKHYLLDKVEKTPRTYLWGIFYALHKDTAHRYV